MHKTLRRFAGFLAALCCLATLPGLQTLAAPVVPSDVPAPTMQGAAGYLLELNTGTTLYEHNANEKLYPASITKIMTALVAIENTKDLSDTLTFSNAAVNGIAWDSSRIGALVGEELTVEQTLYGLMLKSGNDCSVALAEYVSGSEAAFCELMNQRAAEIGCTNTNFTNTHGLHDENHYTTAHDMALIMKTAMENDVFMTIDSTVSYRVPSTNKHSDGFSWTMSNKMMNPRSEYYYEGVVCGKTGYTDQAGNTLVTCAERGDTFLICVVMRCQQTHYADTKLLFDYGFDNFSVYNTSDVTNGLSYDLAGTGFFGGLEDIVGGSSFSIVSNDNYLLLPNSVALTDLQTDLVYDEAGVTGTDNTFATLRYSYQGTLVGESRLELIPETNEGFDFDEHQNPVPETETQVVPEEKTDVVIDPLLIAIVLVVVIAIVIVAILLINYNSPASRRRRQAQLKRQQLRKQRMGSSAGSQQSSLGSVRTTRRRRTRSK